ncbi:MAG: hypothetical protein V4754_05420 [Pseudomonadota bacterium]
MDINTLVLVLALGHLSLGATLLLSGHGGAPFTLPPWTLAKWVQGLAWLLIYWRGALPEPLAFPVADALLCAGVALDAGVLWEAGGRAGWRRPLAAAVAAAAALLIALYGLGAGPALRAAATSALLGAFFLGAAAALGRDWRGPAPCSVAWRW